MDSATTPATDVVERLRQWSTLGRSTGAAGSLPDDLDEAAREIERLRYVLVGLSLVLSGETIEMMDGPVPLIDGVRDADADLANQWEAAVVQARGSWPEPDRS